MSLILKQKGTVSFFEDFTVIVFNTCENDEAYYYYENDIIKSFADLSGHKENCTEYQITQNGLIHFFRKNDFDTYTARLLINKLNELSVTEAIPEWLKCLIELCEGIARGMTESENIKDDDEEVDVSITCAEEILVNESDVYTNYTLDERVPFKIGNLLENMLISDGIIVKSVKSNNGYKFFELKANLNILYSTYLKLGLRVNASPD